MKSGFKASLIANLGLQVGSAFNIVMVGLGLGALKAQNPEPFKLFTKSVIVNITNPKSIVFLVALLPQFMNTNEPQINQVMLLGATMLVVDTVVMIGYSLLAVASHS